MHRCTLRHARRSMHTAQIFMPAITSTSSRIHGEFLRLLFYRPTARPRRTSPPSACQRNSTAIPFAFAARHSTMARTGCPFCRAEWGSLASDMSEGRHGPPGVHALGRAWPACRGTPRGPAGPRNGARPAAPGAPGRCAPGPPRGANSWPRGCSWASWGAPPAPWARSFVKDGQIVNIERPGHGQRSARFCKF